MMRGEYICIRDSKKMFLTKHFVRISKAFRAENKYTARLNILYLVCKTFIPRFESGWHLFKIRCRSAVFVFIFEL